MTRERVAKPVAPLQRAPDTAPKTRASSRSTPLGRLPRTLEAKSVSPAQLEVQRSQQLEVQRLADLEGQRAAIQRAHDDRFTTARAVQSTWRTSSLKSVGVQRAVADHARTARDASHTRAAFVAQRSSENLEALVAQRLELQVRPALPVVQRQADLTLSHVADHLGSKAAVQLARDPERLSSYAGFKNTGAGLVKNFRTPGSSHTMPELAKAIQRFRDPMQRAAVESAAYAAFGSHPTYPKQLQRALEQRDSNLELQREAWQRELELVAQRQALEEASGEGAAQQIESARGGGQPLPAGVRAMLEAKWNTDLSKVRVHTDSSANQISRKLNAKALTTGQDIFFGASTFNPTSLEGLQLIAHEAWHTVQQAGGLVQAGVDKSQSLEVEARGKGAELSSGDVQTAFSSSSANLKAKGISNHTPKPASGTYTATTAPRASTQRFRATHATTRAIQRLASTEETPIGKRGFVREEGLNLRSKPGEEASSLAKLPFGARVFVASKSGAWYRVITENGKSGYVFADKIHGLKAPHQKLLEADPGVRLFRVKPGETGMQLVRRAYGITGAEGSKDQNLWHFLNAIRKRNQTSAFGYKDLGWGDAAQNALIPGADANNVLLKADVDLWIPSFVVAARDNSVGSGTVSGEARRLGKNIEQKVKDFQAAQRYANQAMLPVFAQRLGEGAKELIEGLVSAMIGAAVVLAGTTAIGAIIGAFAGGVGAAPGAAIGFQIGMWMLEWLGLGFLVAWGGAKLVQALSAYGSFVTKVWNANGDQKQLQEAGVALADSQAIVAVAALQILVTIGVAKGLGAAMKGLANSRFGKGIGIPRLQAYLKGRLEAVNRTARSTPKTARIQERLANNTPKAIYTRLKINFSAQMARLKKLDPASSLKSTKDGLINLNDQVQIHPDRLKQISDAQLKDLLVATRSGNRAAMEPFTKSGSLRLRFKFNRLESLEYVKTQARSLGIDFSKDPRLEIFRSASIAELNRLFDLKNSSLPKGTSASHAFNFAIQRKPASVFEFVEFFEFYKAHAEGLAVKMAPNMKAANPSLSESTARSRARAEVTRDNSSASNTNALNSNAVAAANLEYSTLLAQLKLRAITPAKINLGSNSKVVESIQSLNRNQLAFNSESSAIYHTLKHLSELDPAVIANVKSGRISPIDAYFDSMSGVIKASDIPKTVSTIEVMAGSSSKKIIFSDGSMKVIVSLDGQGNVRILSFMK